MKKRALAVLLAVIVVTAGALGVLLVRGQNEVSKMEELCRSSAAAALEEFREYAASGEEHRYWYGVAEFRSFMKAYKLLSEDGNQAEYTWCNSVYGCMVLHPERMEAHMELLIAALELLARDPCDVNGFMRISELNNELLHGES